MSRISVIFIRPF